MVASRSSRNWLAGLLDALLPVLAVLVALAFGAVMLLVLRKNPLVAYGAMWQGAFGNVSGITQVLVKATPLMLVGLGMIIAYRAKVINIGGEGQLIAGSNGLLAYVAELAGLVAAAPHRVRWCAWRGAWAFVPGILKARLGVNEILTTVMMNGIAVQFMNFLLRGPLLDSNQAAMGSNVPQSEALPEQVWLTRLVPRTLLHAGILIALVLVAVVYVLLWRTTLGYRIRAVCLNPSASRYADIPVAWITALVIKTLSGGNIQKAIMARETALNPRILIAAQPTRGVDIGASEAIHQSLLQLPERGTAIMLISEDLDEILALADRSGNVCRRTHGRAVTRRGSTRAHRFADSRRTA